MTAVIIQFPRACRPRLSPIAKAIYDDMLEMFGRGYPNGQIPHSIIDGMECSRASSKPKVVAARREIVASGLAVRTREGDGNGPAHWLLINYPDQRPEPLPMGSV